MDSLISAAARALAGGDPLRALNHVSLRDDAPALALRGIAMAQLGDLARARALLRRASRAFTTRETVARARCVVAEAEVALAARDLHASSKALDAARETLQRHGDTVNAAHARYLAIHRLLLIGRLDDADDSQTIIAATSAGSTKRKSSWKRCPATPYHLPFKPHTDWPPPASRYAGSTQGPRAQRWTKPGKRRAARALPHSSMK